ncbi:hypothetical protein P9239_03590 [Caballeronia sp. LZ062]|uniref:hypothetical protein n=1 Tax=unclassified Caballeronia TaxID=2646786 RepID=UPI002858E58D|nr:MULTISPECIES: hypothetical protein [unclassified Caballeronia]MDR5857166.1 hypothetical protein [Caballeronia sp. LZ050]MDR5869438.1 hypothetical protein [Caballeronia sp. LZ062]
MKCANERSLRFLVEKWLAPASVPVHVKEFSRTRTDHRRFVCVETVQGAASKALFFFRHDDGQWCVYPAAPRAHKARGERLAA